MSIFASVPPSSPYPSPSLAHPSPAPRSPYVTPSQFDFSLKFLKFCETLRVCCPCKCQVTVAFSPLCKVLLLSFKECEFGTGTSTSNCVCSDFRFLFVFFLWGVSQNDKKNDTKQLHRRKNKHCLINIRRTPFNGTALSLFLTKLT